MSEPVYRIKPLVWERFDRDGESWASTSTRILGNIRVYDGYWEYCVDEYYDEGRNDCTSIEDGIAKAEAWYRGRLMEALEEVSEPARGCGPVCGGSGGGIRMTDDDMPHG